MKTAGAKRKPRTARRREVTPATRMLRPADIDTHYGIPPSTLHFYCEELPAAKRLPSVKLPGRKSKTSTGKTKGVRLVYKDELEAWLNRWRTQTAKAS